MTVISVQPIAAGYAYGIRLAFAGGSPPFPDGCTLRAEVRDYPGAPALAGLLTSESGLVSIVDPSTIELFLTPALTGALGRSTCAIDLVRSDASPPVWLGIQLMLPVMTAVTRSPMDTLSPVRIIANGSASVLATISLPPGMTVIVGPALGPGPWTRPQVLAVAALSSSVVQGAPIIRRIDPAAVSVPMIAALIAVVVPPPVVITLPAPPAQTVFVPAGAASSGAAPPAVAFEDPQAVRNAGVAASTMVGSPLLNGGGIPILGPDAIGSSATVGRPTIAGTTPIAVVVAPPLVATTLPNPAVVQPSSTTYAAAGYVADGYVGAS